MTQVLDYTADQGLQELYRWAQIIGLPEYVKSANAGELQPNSNLPLSVYADPGSRQFASGSRATCWLSWLSFLENGTKMAATRRNLVQRNLERFAVHHAIQGDIEHLKAAHASAHSDSLESLSDDNFAIVKVLEDGSKAREYPLRNKQEVKAASSWFEAYRDELDLRDRRRIAERIHERANLLGVGLSNEENQTLLKCARQGTSPAAHVKQAILSRVYAVPGDAPSENWKNLRESMRKLAEKFEEDNIETSDPELRSRVVEILDNFDTRFRLKNRYKSGSLCRPEDACYGTTVDQLAKFAQAVCTLPTGEVFEREEFAKLAVEDVRSLFGNDFADEVNGGLGVDPDRMAEAAETLPRPDSHKLASLLRSKGVAPLLHARTAGGIEGLRH